MGDYPKEPWHTSGTSGREGHHLHVGARDSWTVLASINPTHPQALGVGERIPAAVNFCAGYTTDALTGSGLAEVVAALEQALLDLRAAADRIAHYERGREDPSDEWKSAHITLANTPALLSRLTPKP